MLVFASFKHTIDLIRRKLDSEKISCDEIHGDVSPMKRSMIFDKFQSTADPHVLIIQPHSAAHGVTLTAANTVVWFSPVTSYEIYAQANARVHRKGQRNPCLVVNICGSDVEEKLYKSLERMDGDQVTLMDLYKQLTT